MPMNHADEAGFHQEQALLNSLLADLDRCFEQVVLYYEQRLFAFALRLSGSYEEAQEITQDAFVRAYHALSGYSVEQVRSLALRAWLYQIVLNVARNRLRKLRHLPTCVSLEQASTDADEELEGARAEGPEAHLEARERQRLLQQALLTLPLAYREVIVLRHIEGLSYPELARLLNQPIGTVKARVHRGLAQLRQVLAQHHAREVLYD
ncbi:MAG: sigma-70 family RNA polymerase sigma factor [Thermogemmatispora sp.]|jgi:RNA polymerase sigma-70 factor (ECF subfamily)|nr:MULTISPECIES: sigma-70 family RNA polymerase sigma factor [Thermogemmatispora]MBE3566942.1 sigma-70 family RNA polymerase sigma factor [Thermogemmatispora sp.]